jgi:glycosyltransferase involved in cell wall biosynthesis
VLVVSGRPAGKVHEVGQVNGVKGDIVPLPAGIVLKVSVVIPTLNEAENLPHVLPRIPGWVDEVVLVDGGSTDGTPDVARELLPEVVVVQHLTPGKGAALRRGFDEASGDIIVMLDADGSMDPGEIRSFVGALVGGADFAKGSRFCHGGGTADMEWYRKAGNAALTRVVRGAFGGRYSDLCYGYNAFWRHTIHSLDLRADGFEIETLMNIRALRAGLTITEVPSFEARRIHGTSNLNTVTDGWRVLRTIVRERFSTPFEPRPLTIDLRDGDLRDVILPEEGEIRSLAG